MTWGLDRRPWRHRPAPVEKPLRDELLSIERLEERALALAASFTIDPNPRRRARKLSKPIKRSFQKNGSLKRIEEQLIVGAFCVDSRDGSLRKSPEVSPTVS